MYFPFVWLPNTPNTHAAAILLVIDRSVPDTPNAPPPPLQERRITMKDLLECAQEEANKDGDGGIAASASRMFM
jgi:hypothetical protein